MKNSLMFRSLSVHKCLLTCGEKSCGISKVMLNVRQVMRRLNCGVITTSSYLLVIRKEHGIHEGCSGQEIVLQIVGDMSPPRQPQGFHRRVLHVHEGVHAVAHQSLHYGVLRSLEVVVTPKLQQVNVI